MQAITLRGGATGLNKAGQPTRTVRAVYVRAAQETVHGRHEQKDVSKTLKTTLGAFAAVSLALTGPVSAAEVLPTSVTDQSRVQSHAAGAARKAQNAAPDLSLSKDDELLGNAFQKAGVPGNAPKAADAIRSKVPGLEPQADNPQEAVADSASKVRKGVQNASPDLSLSKDDELLGNAFQKAGIPGNAPEAADKIRSKVPGLEPQADNPQEAVADSASKVRKGVQNASPDLSLGKDDEALGNAFQKIGIPGNAPKKADEIRSKVPGLETQATGDPKQALQDAAGKVKAGASKIGK